MQREEITIKPPFIKLDALLKFAGVAETGGRAKELVAEGVVSVNGETCAMRGRKIKEGDLVSLAGIELTVRFG